MLADATVARSGAVATNSGTSADPDRVVQLLRQSRDDAAARLAQAVAALEKLRIDLLRLRAGNITVAGVTQNLGEARELSAQVRRLLAGLEEVPRTLARA